MHDAPIKELAWIPEMSLLVTGSWDKSLRYWDLRQPNPAHVQQLPERCYALTVKHPLMNPQTEFKRITSPLKYQTRCLAAFPDQQGFLVGSIEGRVGVHHLDDSQQSKNFTFKCHREGNEIYSVNSLNFHPDWYFSLEHMERFWVTVDSTVPSTLWDKDSKQRLKDFLGLLESFSVSFGNVKMQPTHTLQLLNNDGSIYAYAAVENHNPSTAKTYIYLQYPTGARVKGKPRIGSSGRK
ncbi:Poly(A)+ RNA export protein rae1 [Datura stramonium]|uniref:Poly(A)+ RNA export protein rae1 n=1 Tax=Datura stramonium TaxID=4076 RepID=A0ABS8UUI8_DATST|nr:Poly(A)+ RNA export protein rae1 [Datura stramonium]